MYSFARCRLLQCTFFPEMRRWYVLPAICLGSRVILRDCLRKLLSLAFLENDWPSSSRHCVTCRSMLAIPPKCSTNKCLFTCGARRKTALLLSTGRNGLRVDTGNTRKLVMRMRVHMLRNSSTHVKRREILRYMTGRPGH